MKEPKVRQIIAKVVRSEAKNAIQEVMEDQGIAYDTNGNMRRKQAPRQPIAYSMENPSGNPIAYLAPPAREKEQCKKRSMNYIRCLLELGHSGQHLEYGPGGWRSWKKNDDQCLAESASEERCELQMGHDGNHQSSLKADGTPRWDEQEVTSE